MIGELTNHVWQSTLFATAAGLLTVAFRKNRAKVRYWLWLSASVKFLVPFALLMSLGSHSVWAPAAKAIATPAVSLAVTQIAQPFPGALSFAPPAPRPVNWVPMTMLAVWACGFAAIALMRFRDWFRIWGAVRASAAIDIPATVAVRSSPGLLEPGVVGLLRPILLLPEGIAERLTPPQLEAVLAHELCHVRRRDNLFASIHMIVEAIFWFYPLVWWIGARLLDERERACDEEVLNLGGEPHVYAEGILNVCKLYAESPLACVSGVTGSNLKKRMERIMTYRIPKQLGLGKGLLLAAVGTAVLLVVLMAAGAQFHDEFAGEMQPGWQWIDPQGDSAMSLDARYGFLRITVTGYHDLWPANRNYNAPRLMREVQGDFTVETKIGGPERWCGGLLIWKDQDNFVRLDRGIHFKNEVNFEGANNGEFIARARDYAAGDPMFLRLERTGSTVIASYSLNGADWLPPKRLWRLFGFKRNPPQVEDGRSMLAEEDLEFDPGSSSTLFTATGPVLVGVSGFVPAVAPPIGMKQTVTDFDYVTITTP